MPKVRDSSGTIGTIRLPSVLSFMSCVRIRTKTIVVEISRPAPAPFNIGSKALNSGVGSDCARGRRAGRSPPVRRGARADKRVLLNLQQISGMEPPQALHRQSATGTGPGTCAAHPPAFSFADA